MSESDADARVERALACGYEDMCACIAGFTTAAELDRFSRRYNANDGIEPLRGVVCHAECDAGTALFIYWQFHELLDDPAARAATADEPLRWNAHALLTEIERRYPDGFCHHDIACDPIADCLQACGCAYVEGIRTRHAGSLLMVPRMPASNRTATGCAGIP